MLESYYLDGIRDGIYSEDSKLMVECHFENGRESGNVATPYGNLSKCGKLKVRKEDGGWSFL